MKVMREETFGPIAPVVTVGSVDEAIEVANDTEYGLSAGIMTRNEERGLAIARRLNTGMAHINDSSVNDEPHVPFGGVRASGLGRHGGKAGIDQFTEMRWITLERGGRHYPPPFLMNPKPLIEVSLSQGRYLSQGPGCSFILRRLNGTRHSGYWR